MSLKKLSLESLPSLDGGRPAIAFNMLLDRVLADCCDRSADSAWRKVTFEVRVRPIDDTEVEFQIGMKCSVPTLQSRQYHGQVRGHHIAFNAESPDDSRQGTLGFDDQPPPGE